MLEPAGTSTEVRESGGAARSAAVSVTPVRLVLFVASILTIIAMLVRLGSSWWFNSSLAAAEADFRGGRMIEARERLAGLARLWQIGKQKLRVWPFPY